MENEKTVDIVFEENMPSDDETVAEGCDEPDTAGDAEADATKEEIRTLREQVKQLTEELEARAAIADKIAAQIGEFTDLFPEVSMESVPESVWESVRRGSSLAASYALYARKAYMSGQRASDVNQRNARNSPGVAGKGTASEYYTPDEVRAMSQKEVRANYSKIIESMKKWN